MNKTLRKITNIMEEVLKEHPSDRIIFNGDNVVYSVCSENGIGYARISGMKTGYIRLVMVSPSSFTFANLGGKTISNAVASVEKHLQALNRAALIAAKITEKL